MSICSLRVATTAHGSRTTKGISGGWCRSRTRFLWAFWAYAFLAGSHVTGFVTVATHTTSRTTTIARSLFSRTFLTTGRGSEPSGRGTGRTACNANGLATGSRSRCRSRGRTAFLWFGTCKGAPKASTNGRPRRSTTCFGLNFYGPERCDGESWFGFLATTGTTHATNTTLTTTSRRC